MIPRQPFSAVLLCAFAAISLVMAACGDSSGDSTSNTSSNPQTIEISTRWATANADSVQALLASSDAVFVARVVRLVVVREDPFLPASQGDGVPGKPSRGPVSFPFTVFELQIGRSMKGGLTPGSTVKFEQTGGISDQDGTAVRLQLKGDDPIEAGHEYLFFAAYKKNGALSAPPYGRLEVANNGRLQPLKHWAHLAAVHQLGGLTADDAERTVKDAQ